MTAEPLAEKRMRCRIARQERIVRNVSLLAIEAPDWFFSSFVPGQFAHIEVPDNPQMVLRRPMSVHSIHPEDGTVRFAYNIVGKGTRALSEARAGDELNVIMPLGNGFLITPDMRRIWLVGGGMGAAPLASVLDVHPDREYEVFLGFRSGDDVFGTRHFEGCRACHIATDDGSQGEKGVITDVLASRLKEERPDAILACGPDGMFHALARTADDVPTQVCVEERMGCGTGGCETCVCKVRGHFLKTCSDGPVFNLKEVDEYHD